MNESYLSDAKATNYIEPNKPPSLNQDTTRLQEDVRAAADQVSEIRYRLFGDSEPKNGESTIKPTESVYASVNSSVALLQDVYRQLNSILNRL